MLPFYSRHGVDGEFWLSLLSKGLFLSEWTLSDPLIHLMKVFSFNFILSLIDYINDFLLRTLKSCYITQNS